jgi:hypothetical protein
LPRWLPWMLWISSLICPTYPPPLPEIFPPEISPPRSNSSKSPHPPMQSSPWILLPAPSPWPGRQRYRILRLRIRRFCHCCTVVFDSGGSDSGDGRRAGGLLMRLTGASFATFAARILRRSRARAAAWLRATTDRYAAARSASWPAAAAQLPPKPSAFRRRPGSLSIISKQTRAQFTLQTIQKSTSAIVE